MRSLFRWDVSRLPWFALVNLFGSTLMFTAFSAVVVGLMWERLDPVAVLMLGLAFFTGIILLLEVAFSMMIKDLGLTNEQLAKFSVGGFKLVSL